MHRPAVRVALEGVGARNEVDFPGRVSNSGNVRHLIDAGSLEVEVVDARPVVDEDRVMTLRKRRHVRPVRVLHVDLHVGADGSDQIRRPVVRGERIDQTPAEVVVGQLADASALRPVTDRDVRIGGRRQDLLGGSDVPGQLGVSRP